MPVFELNMVLLHPFRVHGLSCAAGGTVLQDLTLCAWTAAPVHLLVFPSSYFLTTCFSSPELWELGREAPVY